MNKKKWALVIGIIVVLLSIGLIFHQKFNLLGGCSSKVVKEISSDTNKVEVSIVDCGATTDYTTHIDLSSLKDKTETTIVVLKGDHSNDLNVIWITLEKVEIRYKGVIEDAFNFQNKINNINFKLETYN